MDHHRLDFRLRILLPLVAFLRVFLRRRGLLRLLPRALVSVWLSWTRETDGFKFRKRPLPCAPPLAPRGRTAILDLYLLANNAHLQSFCASCQVFLGRPSSFPFCGRQFGALKGESSCITKRFLLLYNLISGLKNIYLILFNDTFI
jgi:hypothetical protein